MTTFATRSFNSLTGGPQSPAQPSATASVTWQPVGMNAARITGGFWAPRLKANASGAIREGFERLESAGNLQNLRIAAGDAEGEAVGPVFADSDVYKWLEAVAWEYARQPTPELLVLQRQVTALVAAAQEEDGYLDSVVKIRSGKEGRYQQLVWSHEHYCAGHLIQAAVAQVRCTGDRGLLEVAIRLADHLRATFGEDKRHDVDGHPVVEMALVELFRETQNQDYLDLASYFVEARGHGLMEKYGKAPTYFSDRVPVRDATTVEGHAVRAVYLAAGAADLAVELGDTELLNALALQFSTMWATKTYLTGGLGARWEGEAFGDPYELPSDRAYAETCAAIGGVQWAWRMLLATGDPGYADAIERMLYNGFLAGVSLTGTKYFYVNALRVRSGAHADEHRTPAGGRHGWFDCACCPPNMMRTFASLASYLASHDDSGLHIHQYATGVLEAVGFRVEVTTDYPWDGRVVLRVTEAPQHPSTLSLRIPGWAAGATVSVDGEVREAAPGILVLDHSWSGGVEVVLDLPLNPRLVHADPRIDDIRGSVALERGPVVYAFEGVDQPEGLDLDAAELVTAAPVTTDYIPDLLGGVTVLRASGRLTEPGEVGSSWPYSADAEGRPAASSPARDVSLTAIPYYAWANRGVGAMRVWLPRADD